MLLERSNDDLPVIPVTVNPFRGALVCRFLEDGLDKGIAVLGAGMIGAAHAASYRALLPRFAGLGLSLHTVCDARADAAATLARTYGFAQTATDWRAVVADPNIGIVSVALPNMAHEDVVLACLAAGKHVLCEKPLALSAAGAQALVNAARSAQVTAATVFNYRRFPALADILSRVAAGEIGRPVHLQLSYCCEYAADPLLPHSWRYERARAGGGALADVGTHALDIALALCGPLSHVAGALSTTTIPERYLAVSATAGHGRGALGSQTAPVDTDDVFSGLLSFASGCQGTLTASRVAVGFGNTLAFTLSGTEGSIVYSTERPGEFRLARRRAGKASLIETVFNSPASPYAADYLPVPHDGVAVGYAEAFTFLIGDFLSAVAAGQPMQKGSLEDGMHAAIALEALQRSATERRPVAIAELSGQTIAA